MEEKRNTPIFLVSLLALQFWAMVFAGSAYVNIQFEQFQPAGNSTVGDAAANSLILLIPVLIFTFFLIFVIRNYPKIFRTIVIVFPLVLLLLYTPFVFAATLIFFVENADFAIVLGFLISVLLMISGVYSLWKNIIWLRTTITFILSATIGAILANSFSPPTLFVFPIAFAIYDIYAVFIGPLKKLAGDFGKQPKKGKTITDTFGFLLSNIGGFNIGTGDLVFYSMIASAAFILKGFFASLLIVALIEFGTYLTTWLLLKYKRMLPGLPIPIFLGTGALILLYYL